MRKLKLFSLAVMALFSTGLWAADVTLKSIDFSTWSDQTICPDKDNNPQTVLGITFYSKVSSNKTKPASINNGVLTWFNNNSASDGYFLAFPITGINDGTITIKVYNGDSNTNFKYIVHDGGTAFATSPTASKSGNPNDGAPATATITGLANTYAYVYIGRNGSGKTTATKIEVLTPAPACDPIGVASTGTATDVTYSSASLPFTMDKTTGVSSLTIEVFKNSDDSKVATYSDITPATSGSQAATGLSESTTYYYTITTVSEGGDFCEGETTAKSATFTTSAAPVSNPVITGAVNENGWGTVAPASITVTSGDVLAIAENVITCGGKTLTATAAEATDEYTYAFDSWSGVSAGEVTTNLTATANFTRSAKSYDVNYTAPTNGAYTIKVGDESAVSESTTAAYGQTVKLAATPNSGYKLGSWSVYKTGDENTKVTVTNNQFTMPAYEVTISATFVEATILYDCSVMADAGNKSFTDETVTANATGKSKTFGTSGNPQLIVENGGWDKKDNIINSFIKFIKGSTNMSIVIPNNRYATVTIKYGSYDKDKKYLTVDGVAQNKPRQTMVDGLTDETYENYMGIVELTDQSGTLILDSNADKANLYIAYVDVAITGTITPTALDNTDASVKAVKRLENGMLVIEKNGVRYNAQGQVVH